MFNFIKKFLTKKNTSTSKQSVYIVDVEQFKIEMSKLSAAAPVIPPNRSLKDLDKIYLDTVTNINNLQGSDLPIIELDDPKIFTKLMEKYTDETMKYVFHKLELAIVLNLPAAHLFQFSPSNALTQIDKNNYERELVKIMQYFIKQENYESAGNCRDLIRQLKSDDVVDQR